PRVLSRMHLTEKSHLRYFYKIKFFTLLITVLKTDLEFTIVVSWQRPSNPTLLLSHRSQEAAEATVSNTPKPPSCASRPSVGHIWKAA
ncbi:hypothetical protein STEG23_001128, partial [Scotinomys teguina]